MRHKKELRLQGFRKPFVELKENKNVNSNSFTSKEFSSDSSSSDKSNPADSIEIAKVEQGPNSVKTISQSTTSQIVADLSLMQRVNIDKIDGQAEATNNS